MKKISIIIICFLAGAGLARSQQSCDDLIEKKNAEISKKTTELDKKNIELDKKTKELDKKTKELDKKTKELNEKVIECNELKIKYQAVSKELSDAKKEYVNSSNKKFSKKGGKQPDTIKSLPDSMAIENKRLQDLLKATNATLELLKKDTAVQKQTIRELEMKNSTLENQSKAGDVKLSGEIKRLEKENKEYTSTISRLQSDSTRLSGLLDKCKSDRANLPEINKALEVTNQNLTKERDGLLTDKTKLTKENATMLTEKQTLNERNNQLATENNSLKTLLSGNIKSMVHSVTQGGAYDPVKADDAIALCEGAAAYASANEISVWKSQLNQFKTLCLAITDAKAALDKPYDHTAANQAIGKLDACKPFNQTQTDDKNTYKALLQQYCDESKYCIKYIETADKWLPTFPNKTTEEINKILKNVDLKYTYLHEKLNLKRKNPTSRVTIPNNCN